MKTYKNLYPSLCSYENLELAFKKARKKKTLKPYVIEFESNLESNLSQLKAELETFAYSPRPLTDFIVKDPKTRKISSSHFRDRVVHHAICNIISPILEKYFIHNSFANQKGKGVHKAILRFEKFQHQVSCRINRGGGTQFSKTQISGYVLKADIRHYFETVDHGILLSILKRNIKDEHLIRLITIILQNHKTEIKGNNHGQKSMVRLERNAVQVRGMPLGNLTSQFFANVYLNELDQFVKHKLKAKHYIRYVDDFLILHQDKKILEKWKIEIENFLKQNLALELHPEKSRIIPLCRGTTLLGFRVFYHYRLLKKSNAKRIWKRIESMEHRFNAGDLAHEKITQSISGWIAYAKFANTYNLRRKVIAKCSRLFGKRGEAFL